MMPLFPSAIRPLLLCLVITGLSLPASAAGKFKCWTNNEGVRECGHSVPPEYSQQRIETLNEQGVVVEVEEPAKTSEQLEQEKREAAIRKEQERREKEKRRQDMILLRTFTTERDLKLSYEDRAAAIESLIGLTRSNINSLQENLGQLQKRAANIERAGNQIPDNLLKDMEDIKRQIANNQEFIADKQQNLKILNQKYEADLERFRELKSVKPR